MRAPPGRLAKRAGSAFSGCGPSSRARGLLIMTGKTREAGESGGVAEGSDQRPRGELRFRRLDAQGAGLRLVWRTGLDSPIRPGSERRDRFAQLVLAEGFEPFVAVQQVAQRRASSSSTRAPRTACSDAWRGSRPHRAVAGRRTWPPAHSGSGARPFRAEPRSSLMSPVLVMELHGVDVEAAKACISPGERAIDDAVLEPLALVDRADRGPRPILHRVAAGALPGPARPRRLSRRSCVETTASERPGFSAAPVRLEARALRGETGPSTPDARWGGSQSAARHGCCAACLRRNAARRSCARPRSNLENATPKWTRLHRSSRPAQTG